MQRTAATPTSSGNSQNRGEPVVSWMEGAALAHDAAGTAVLFSTGAAADAEAVNVVGDTGGTVLSMGVAGGVGISVGSGTIVGSCVAIETGVFAGSREAEGKGVEPGVGVGAGSK